MARMGYGYGSEWQLTRFLGRHRQRLTRAVEGSTGLSDVEWLDFRFKSSDWLGDGELLGLDFIEDEDLKAEWSAWWPTGSGIMNWDAVGRGITDTGTCEWVLVEAKGNLKELGSNCGAGPKSLAKIQSALADTRSAMGVSVSEEWTVGHYQHANRLAVLHFLSSHDVPARLVYILFTGETDSDSRSPGDRDGWQEAMGSMKAHLGLTGTSEMESRVHDIYIDVGAQS